MAQQKQWAIRVILRDGSRRLLAPYRSKVEADRARPSGGNVASSHVFSLGSGSSVSGSARVVQQTPPPAAPTPAPPPEDQPTDLPIESFDCNGPSEVAVSGTGLDVVDHIRYSGEEFSQDYYDPNGPNAGLNPGTAEIEEWGEFTNDVFDTALGGVILTTVHLWGVGDTPDYGVFVVPEFLVEGESSSPIDNVSYNSNSPNGDLYVWGTDIGEDFDMIYIMDQVPTTGLIIRKTDPEVTRWEGDLIRISWPEDAHGVPSNIGLPGSHQVPNGQDTAADTVIINSYGQGADTNPLTLESDSGTFQVPPIEELWLVYSGGSVGMTKTDVINAGGTWTDNNISVPASLHGNHHITMVRFETNSNGVIGRAEVG